MDECKLHTWPLSTELACKAVTRRVCVLGDLRKGSKEGMKKGISERMIYVFEARKYAKELVGHGRLSRSAPRYTGQSWNGDMDMKESSIAYNMKWEHHVGRPSPFFIKHGNVTSCTF